MKIFFQASWLFFPSILISNVHCTVIFSSIGKTSKLVLVAKIISSVFIFNILRRSGRRSCVLWNCWVKWTEKLSAESWYLKVVKSSFYHKSRTKRRMFRSALVLRSNLKLSELKAVHSLIKPAPFAAVRKFSQFQSKSVRRYVSSC